MMMKFTCNTGELNQGINSALLAVSPKSTLLALEGILVRVTTKEITLMSYNLEMGITAIVDAKVEKTGEIIIPAKVFSDIIRRIESDEVTIVPGADHRRCFPVHHPGHDLGRIP